MVAPEGISNKYENTNPENELMIPIIIEANIIFLKSEVKIFAMVCGTVSSEITRMIPTSLILKTIVAAVNAISK